MSSAEGGAPMSDVPNERFCPECGHEGQETRCPNDDFPMLRSNQRVHWEPANTHLRGSLLADRYQFLEMLGRGTSGWVYRGRHLTTHQTVAIKVLKREMMADLHQIRRFYLEARTCSQLNHPNIISVYDFGVTSDDLLYTVMELLDGEPLNQRLRREGKLPLEVALELARQVCRALDTAHAAGIVHRDLKPSNLYLCALRGGEDFVKVLDFGLAKVVGESEGAGAGITHAGLVVGSPGYVAPEQIMGANLDGRADLYALGITLFEMLTGSRPFDSKDPTELLRKHLTVQPPPLPMQIDGEPVPAPLATLIARLLDKDPAKRPASAQEVEEELGAIASARGIGRTVAALASRPEPEWSDLLIPADTPAAEPAVGRPAGQRRLRWLVVSIVALGASVAPLLSDGDEMPTANPPVAEGERGLAEGNAAPRSSLPAEAASLPDVPAPVPAASRPTEPKVQTAPLEVPVPAVRTPPERSLDDEPLELPPDTHERAGGALAAPSSAADDPAKDTTDDGPSGAQVERRDPPRKRARPRKPTKTRRGDTPRALEINIL